jgi:hypothetical protein
MDCAPALLTGDDIRPGSSCSPAARKFGTKRCSTVPMPRSAIVAAITMHHVA